MESKFESGVKHIPYSCRAVFGRLSDMSNIEKVKDRLPQDKVKDLTFDRDSVTVSVPPVGGIRLKIIEREEPKCIKFVTEQSPLPFRLWIQLLPEGDEACKMKLTIKAELNPFIRGMVAGPLQDGIEKIADTLAMIEYQ